MDDSWSALAHQLALLLALVGMTVAAWLAIRALARHETLSAVLVSVPTLLGLATPAATLVSALADFGKLLLAD